MTTPERLRRRQYIESALIVVLGIGMLIQGWYFGNKAADQAREDALIRSCLVDNFTDLSIALKAGRKITERETRINRREASAAARVNLAELIATTNEEYLVELQRYERIQERLQAQRAQIEQDREENPLPPYPVGECLP